MIAFLKGTVEEKTPAAVYLDVGGVGYEVFISLNTYDFLPAKGERCKLLTHHLVREDDQMLFGFAQPQEKEMFEQLITVNGVGPRLALSILSGMTVADLGMAISDGNAKRIASIKGIGKKTAEKIVVELRDRINPVAALAAVAAEGKDRHAAIARDTILALQSLGFPEDVGRKMVQAALAASPDVNNTQELLRKALNSK
ncbi:MAG: Holliday junction branch migration protein RuvA [Kiritimatiellae bacterium]|nr:Holliday junction branch migration protein RuvA [Kiritimatiellia bacterium]